LSEWAVSRLITGWLQAKLLASFWLPNGYELATSQADNRSELLNNMAIQAKKPNPGPSPAAAKANSFRRCLPLEAVWIVHQAGQTIACAAISGHFNKPHFANGCRRPLLQAARA
jgi:hypothetical protein